jgi:transcriptional regulator with XRE-family HTH domain
MSARRRAVEIGFARGRRLVVDISREVDAARRSSGMSYATLGRAVGLSGDQVARICRAESPNVSVIRLATLHAAVGLELSARSFPAGPPIRDAAHLRLLARFKDRLAPSLRWRLEVPVTAVQGFVSATAGHDQRAWDAVIEGAGWSIGVEAETRIGDAQALLRRISLKRRDGNVDLVVLLVNDTTHNREVLLAASEHLRTELPGSTRHALRALGAGIPLRTSSVVVL